MIYIVHGDDIAKSRILILNQQKKLQISSRIEVNTEEADPEGLYQIVNTPDIFGVFPFVVLDISQAGRTNLDKYMEAAQRSTKNEQANLVILSNKPLSKANTFIKNLKALNAKELQLNAEPIGNVFNFVDALLAKNRTRTYKELGKLNEDTAPFEIFNKIVFGVRNIMLAVLEAPSFEKLHPYVKKKTLDSARKYKKETVLKLFTELYEIEKGTKIGEIDADTAVTLAIEKVLNS